MSLSLYLAGAPGAGKSAVFDALTQTPQGPLFAVQSGRRIGSVKVPDPRLEGLRGLYRPRKCTPVEVTFVDPGPPGGNARAGDLAPILQEADAFMLVVQAFGDTDRAGRPADPAGGLESALLDLAVADLEKIERRLERADRESKRGRGMPQSERDLLGRCRARLESGSALAGGDWREDEIRALREYSFLTWKPALAVANLPEDRLDGSGLDGLRALADQKGLELLPFCAPLESELARLEPGEQAAFLRDYGLDEPARARVLRAAFRTLRLIRFYTVVNDEARAWAVREGTRAAEAAGKIHSDMERGFIRAETVPADTLLAAGSWAKCRESAALRLEGRDYAVRDGDVLNIRFGV